MKIAILSPLLVFGGGAERVIVSLGHQFQARGIETDFVVLSDSPEERLPLPPRSRLVELGSARGREAFRPLVRYLRAERPDAVLSNIWPLTCLAIFAARLASPKSRVVVVDHNTLSRQFAGEGPLHRLALAGSIGGLYPFAAVRVAVSEGVADDLAALSGIARNRFRVIHNPVEIAPPGAGDEQKAEAAWSGWTGARILTVGRLKRQKNHALLVHAFKALIRTREARLMIVGGGPLERELAEMVRAEGLNERVILMGAVPEPAPLYRSADLFALASDYEGFGNVLVEALGHGLPVVSTDCPSGPAEILAGGRYGRLVPVGEVEAFAAAMAAALDDRPDRDMLQRRAAAFAPSLIAEQYLEALLPGATSWRTGQEIRIG